jgi:hypothetical protein
MRVAKRLASAGKIAHDAAAVIAAWISDLRQPKIPTDLYRDDRPTWAIVKTRPATTPSEGKKGSKR